MLYAHCVIYLLFYIAEDWGGFGKYVLAVGPQQHKPHLTFNARQILILNCRPEHTVTFINNVLECKPQKNEKRKKTFKIDIWGFPNITTRPSGTDLVV